jgi:hypothetical protein
MKPELRQRLVRSTSNALFEDLERIEERLGEEGLDEARTVELNTELSRLVGGIGEAAGELLAASDQDDAEELFTPILSEVRRESEQEQIESALTKFERGESQDFSVGLVRWLTIRPTDAFARNAGKLSGAVLGDATASELGGLAARFWREAAEEQSGEAGVALASVGEIHRDGAKINFVDFHDALNESLRRPLANEQEVNIQRGRTELVKELPGSGLMSEVEAGDALLEAASAAMTETPAADQEPSVARYIVELVDWAATRASSTTLSVTAQALEQSPWLAQQSPETEILRLQIEGGLNRQDEARPSPFKPAKVKELVDSHGGNFTAGLIPWLRDFHPAPEHVSLALRSLLFRQLPPPLTAALSEYSNGLRPADRFLLLKALMQRSYVSPRQARLLGTLGIQDADPVAVTSLLVERYKSVTTNSAREGILRIWRAFEPQDPALRRTLIKQILIPLSGHGVGGYELVRRYLDLATDPPRGTKGKLLEALEGEGQNRKRRRAMRRRMEEVGLRKRKGSD